MMIVDRIDHQLDRQFRKLVKKAAKLSLLPQKEAKNIIKELANNACTKRD